LVFRTFGKEKQKATNGWKLCLQLTNVSELNSEYVFWFFNDKFINNTGINHIMAHLWLYTILSVIIVSLISLIGIFTISLSEKRLKKVLLFFVSFAAGALFGDAFIHLLPKVVEEFGFSLTVSLSFLAGVLVFFVLEKYIHWRHCHVPTSKDHPHPLAVMNLIGDALHNLLDGIIIAGSYLANVGLGIATTIAVLFHEIPQEIGDFGVLLHAGMKRKKALFMNFLTALTSLLGVFLVFILGGLIDNLTTYLLPFTAGGFIYIAGSDLIPELKKETRPGKSLLQLLSIILGILVMLALLLLE